ncbi:hypothetical protein H5T58_02135, partial [Candidatus Parcubacteria bacterium]|nr:hypothetical protein [Candidatus Parcubacteria bacterium]
MEKLKDKILEKIKKGEIKMKPKLYFLLKSILFVLVLGFLVLFSFFLVSFIRFHLISSGLWYLPNFGPEGVLAFLRF